MIWQSKLHNLNYPWSGSLKGWLWTAVVSWAIRVPHNSKALVFGHGAARGAVACRSRRRFAACWSCLAQTPPRPGIRSGIRTGRFAFITLSLQMDRAGVLATVSVETWGCDARARCRDFRPCWMLLVVLTASRPLAPRRACNAVSDCISTPPTPQSRRWQLRARVQGAETWPAVVLASEFAGMLVPPR